MACGPVGVQPGRGRHGTATARRGLGGEGAGAGCPAAAAATLPAAAARTATRRRRRGHGGEASIHCVLPGAVHHCVARASLSPLLAGLLLPGCWLDRPGLRFTTKGSAPAAACRGADTLGAYILYLTTRVRSLMSNTGYLLAYCLLIRPFRTADRFNKFRYLIFTMYLDIMSS